jgi:hypothetical protein
VTGDRGPTGPPGPTGDIHDTIKQMFYQVNWGVQSPDMWQLIQRLALRITGTGPLGPTYPISPTAPPRGDSGEE